MNFYQANLDIIIERWPDIAQRLQQIDLKNIDAQYLESNSNTLIYQGIQLSSSYDALAEAKIQCRQIDETSNTAYLYGTGLGQVPQILLARPHLQQLNVSVLNVVLFAVELTYFDQKSWLKDKRVKLNLGSKVKFVSFPFIALPAELVLAEDACAQLRDRICLELDSAFIEKSNSMKCRTVAEAVQKNTELIKVDNDISVLVEQFNQPLAKSKAPLVVIAAAGPTLEYHYQWLAEQLSEQTIILIAVDAAVKPLLAANILPNIIVSIDKVGSGLFSQVNLSRLKEVPLVYFPLLEPQFLLKWPSKRYVTYSTGESFDDIALQFPKTRLYCGGSVIHPSIDLAVKMGAQKILLLGADFSLVNQQTHAKDTEILSERTLLSPEDTTHWVLNGRNKKVPTYLNFRGYLRELERYIEHHKQVHFYTGSLDGAMIEGAPLWPQFIPPFNE